MPMTTQERYRRMFEHREADRVPIIDHPWPATIERWQREGLPEGVGFEDYFDIDHVAMIAPDTSPRYEEKTVEETDTYRVYTTKWGVTMKKWKHADSTPEFREFTIVDPESWKKAVKRMEPGRDRVDWDQLKKDYAEWRAKGHWVQGVLWFGFDVTHSWTVGTERLLMAMADQPEWCIDMFNTMLDRSIAMLEMVWDAGLKFDCTFWYDDMGYKHNQFFSPKMYRELLKPAHKRAIEWAHRKGIPIELHSCGDISPLVPDLVKMGLDALNPLEVKAGMDTLALKKKFGKKLVLHGGINAVLWEKFDAIEAEVKAKLPVMKVGGGYIFGTDHSVPSCVSLKDFGRFVELGKKLGSYE